MHGFSEILGNEMIKEYFTKVLADGDISHAYILTGEAGMGRMSIARAFAMTLLCENSNTEPCGTCHSCVQFLTDNHPDVIYVTHEKAHISVDDIRLQIIDTVMIRPYSSEYKIYIVNDAETMTEAAQNALLKTLEDPPEYVIIFLLATRTDVFAPTLLSRCVNLKLKPLYDSVIHDYLTDELKVSTHDADLYTAFARGNLGKAISLASSEEFQQLRERVLYLLRSIRTMDTSMILDVVREWKADKMDIDECLDFIQLWYRDVLMFKATQDTSQVIFKDEYRYIQEAAEKSSFPGIEKILEAVDTARVRLKANVNFDLTIELMLLTVKEN